VERMMLPGVLMTFPLTGIPKARLSAATYPEPQGSLNPSGTDGNITLTHGFTTETGTAQAGAATAITLASGENSANDLCLILSSLVSQIKY